jgi:XTP/dITP diphosphohydrolase
MRVTFLIATGNRGKLREIERILAPMGHTAVSLSQAGVCVRAEETGKTFEENAMIKALAASQAADMPCIADDSGLETDALGGAPGIFSARYAGEGATDADRIAKLLAELADVPEEKRTARFICAVACVFPDGRFFTVRGACEGRIAFAPCGEGGFGYDPVFIEASSGRTFAQLAQAEKDAVSHRGRALRAFAEKLGEYI